MTKTVSEKKTTENVAAIAVAAALKDKTVGGGGKRSMCTVCEEEEGKQGTVERKEVEDVSQGIQGCGLPQRKG